MLNADMSYRQSPNARLIEEFSNSGCDMCKVEYDTEKYPKINRLASSLTNSAKTYGKPHIRAIVYNNNIYLVNRLKG